MDGILRAQRFLRMTMGAGWAEGYLIVVYYNELSLNFDSEMFKTAGYMKSDIITLSFSVEVPEMPFLQCPGCDKTLDINVGQTGTWNKPDKDSNPSTLIGSAICRGCGTGIGFEITDNIIVYVSGKTSYGKIDASLTGDIKMIYAEAELCFQNGTPNASATMCRVALELALIEAGLVGNNLFELITDGKNKTQLNDIEVGLAHSSRLITRDAIHRSEFVSLADVPSILSATIRILNKLASPPA